MGLGTPYIPTIAGGKVGSLDGLRYGSAAKGIMGRKDHVIDSYIPLLEKFRVTAEQYYKDDCAEKDSFQKE